MDENKQQKMLDRKLEHCPRRYQAMLVASVVGELSPRQAIKVACLECVCWQKTLVRTCTSLACPLYPLRPYQEDGVDDEPGDVFEDACEDAERATLAN